MYAASLIPRRHSNNDDDSSKRICPAEAIGPDIVPFVADLTFHEFATILSGACAAASCLIMLIVILLHSFNYSNPIQQRQVIRILLLVPWVAIFAFLIIWQEGAGEYLLESLDFGCAIAISAFLLLLCDYILSNTGGFDALFGPGAARKGQFASDSPEWLKRTWYMVLQFIPASVFLWVATCITVAAGVYCSTSNSLHFAHIWLTIFKLFVTIIAVVAVFRFHSKMKSHLAPHKVLLKFFAFKGIIGLNALQTFIINILVGNDTISPSKYLTSHDIKVGLPSLILACEMPIFAILLAVAFPVSIYKKSEGPAAGPITAIIQALNITDLLSSFVRGPMRLLREQQWGIQRQDSHPLMADSDDLPVYQAQGPSRV